MLPSKVVSVAPGSRDCRVGETGALLKALDACRNGLKLCAFPVSIGGPRVRWTKAKNGLVQTGDPYPSGSLAAVATEAPNGSVVLIPFAVICIYQCAGA